MALMKVARPALVVVLVALGLLATVLDAAAQDRSWEGDGAIPLVWWPLIALLAAVVMSFLVGWGLLHLMPIVLAVIGAVFGLRWLIRAGRHRESDRALEILRERYARGELSRGEFEGRRRDLSDRQT